MKPIPNLTHHRHSQLAFPGHDLANSTENDDCNRQIENIVKALEQLQLVSRNPSAGAVKTIDCLQISGDRRTI
jgi:hypothetical protein